MDEPVAAIMNTAVTDPTATLDAPVRATKYGVRTLSDW